MFGLLRAYRAELFFLLLLGVLYAAFATMFELNAFTELPLYETAREVVDGENWKLPNIQHGMISPLMLGCVALCLKLFGVGIGIARIPAIIFSLLGVVLVYVFSILTIKSRTTAFSSAIAMGTSLGYFGLAPLAASGTLMMDVMLLTFIALQLWRNLLEKRKPQPSEIYKACGFIGFCLALLFLTQGWLTLLSTLMIILAFFMFSRSFHLGRAQQIWNWTPALIGFGTPLVLATAITLLFPKGGQAIGHFLLTSGFGQFTFFQNNPLLDVSTLLLGLFPYIFFLGSFIWEWMAHKRSAGPSHLGKEPLILLASWLCVSLAVSWIFSPAETITFLIPCIAPLACMMGSYVARFFDGEEPTNAYRWSVELTIISIAILAVLLSIFLFNTLSEVHPVEFWHFPGPAVISQLHIVKDIELDPPFPVWKLWLTPGPFILLFTAIVLYTLHTLRRSRQVCVTLMALWIVFLLFMKFLFIPVLQRPVHRENAITVQKLLKPNTTLWIDNTQRELLPTFFYLNLTDKRQSIFFSKDPAADLTRWLQSPMYHRMVGVIPEQYYYALDPELRTNMRILNHSWKWVRINPTDLSQLFNADYMKTLTYTTLVFETLPQDTPVNWEAGASEKEGKSKKRQLYPNAYD